MESIVLSLSLDSSRLQYEILQIQAEYGWKLKSAENSIVKLEKNSESIVVRICN